MSSIYLHIPFCKQACHYCDFHFSTSLKHKEKMIDAICQELALRKEELRTPMQNIYFGGGTPSLLNVTDFDRIFDSIHSHYDTSQVEEITLEANPDDLNEAYLQVLDKKTPINRLSIGVQSFIERDLKLMNRAHNASEALESLQLAKKYFDNISLDLIYGIPGLSEEEWLRNIEQALSLEIPHLSCYALTVEPKTALAYFIEKEVIPPVDDELAKCHFDILQEKMTEAGYVNYEFSNFGKPGFESKNNTAYWTGKSYLGIGPSAHSFDGSKRSWNVSNNAIYIKKIQANELPSESETLTKTDTYNEYVMTRLRTQWGIDLNEIENKFGLIYRAYLTEQAQEFIKDKLIFEENEHYIISPKGKFLSDGIASELFMLNLK